MSRRPVLGLFAVVGCWALAAAVMPPIQDEAYYFSWSRNLAAGYFDHPPLVAFMAATSRLGGGVFVARLGTLLVGLLTMLSTLRLARIAGFTERGQRQAAVVLAFGNVLGLVTGVYTTPDTALILAWTLALSEAALALRGDARRWLTAGAATGLGLLAKYTMLFMGPVFVLALVFHPKGRWAGLKSPWPYLGALMTALVFAPNLWWNANNDWLTLRFQMRHGLAMERPVGAAEDRLPAPEITPKYGAEWSLAEPFRDLEKVTAHEEKKPGPYADALKALNRYVGYFAAQVAFWGAFAVAIPRLWRRRRRGAASAAQTILPELRPLFLAATWTPLAIVGLLSLKGKVEANWSAMYVVTAAFFLAPLFAGSRRLLRVGVLCNAALVLIAAFHARTGFLPVTPHKDRLLAETHGFADMADTLAKLNGPIFAPNYQLVAETTFYRPDVKIYQWPGLTRASEYLRSPAWTGISERDLEVAGQFWLIANEVEIPHLPGFQAAEMAQLRDCKDESLQLISSQAAVDVERRCKKPIHEWYLIRYLKAEGVW